MGHNKNNLFNGNENNREDYINEVVPDDVAVGDVAEQPEQAEEIEVPVDDENGDEIEALKNLLQQKDEQIEKEKKEYLFLMADFDNFRKRTLKEKSEILKNGAESAMKGLLPIVDDFER